MPRATSAASASCGIQRGLTKLVISMCSRPVAESASMNAILSDVGIGRASFCRPSRGGLADVNHDGLLDAIVANTDSSDVTVHLGEGAGAFLPAVGYGVGSGPTQVVLLDVNGDQQLDIVTPDNGSDDITVLLGD